MTHLMLDAAYPPQPRQWVADMNAVGADGGFVYVWGPITNYSGAHVTAAQQANKVVIPIIVPGNAWPSFTTLLQYVRAYNFTGGPVLVDLESGSLPPNQGLVDFASFMQNNGFTVDRYGNTSTLGKYTPEGEDWIADWIRTGQLQPLPSLPTGWQSWQFVNDVSINGSQYDASIVSDSFITGAVNDMLDPTDGIVKEFREKLNSIEVMLSAGKRQGANFDAQGNVTYVDEPGWPNWIATTLQSDTTAIGAAIADVKTALGNLQVPPADVQPVIDAVNKLSAHLGLGTA